MSLSNGADATSIQQKPQLPNPFDLTDPEILEKVYVTHLHDDDKCDVDVLFDVVSSVILKVLSNSSSFIHSFSLQQMQIFLDRFFLFLYIDL